MTLLNNQTIIINIKHDISIDQDSVLSIDSVLDSFFEKSIKDASKIDPSYARLWKHLHDLIRSGGKRLRPKMTLMAYQAFGQENTEPIIPVAAAQELLHFALLIHDDIIDRDYVRYGVPNIAGRYKKDYSSNISSEDNLTHYAHSAAILGGDLMISGAYKLIAASSLSDKEKTTAQHLLSAGIFEVAGGELLDTELSFMQYKNGDAIKVAIYKTASYSFELPLLTGARLAGASEKQCAILRKYAVALGIAFQLADDLMGTFGSEQVTGKSTSSDITEGKRTYLVEMALQNLSADHTTVFKQAFGNQKASQLEVEAAKQLLELSGARQKTEEKIAEYAYTAATHLKELNLPSRYHQQFTQMISKATNRKS